MMLLLLLCAAAARSQVINLSVKNASLESVFTQLEKQSGYTFFYKVELIRTLPAVTVDIRHATIQEALDLCLAHEPLSYSIIQKTVVIKPKAEPAPQTGAAAPTGARLIRGKVFDREGRPLAGVSIALEGTAYGWTTSADGTFICALAGSALERKPVFVFTSVGFARQRRPLPQPGTELVVTMQQQINDLDEIQMTAYSTTSKRYNTGDITTVTSDEIARNPVDNVLEALQGRVAGMFVTQQTGVTNGAFRVQIRSVNTLTGTGGNGTTITPGSGGQPLYIVDGVEYPANTTLPMSNGVYGGVQPQEFGNALNYLDPETIESINVLKGADATAIYGSRGAFGVILITTKRARAGKPTLTATVYQGVTELGTSPKLMNTQQYLAVRHNAFANDGTQPGNADLDLNGTWDTTRSVNWQKYFLGGHAPTTKVTARYSGGSANANFMIGAHYNEVGNIQISKGNVRSGGVDLGLNANTNDRKVTLAVSGSFNNNIDDRVLIDFTGTSGVLQAPDAPSYYLPNGQLNWSTGANALSILNSSYSNNTNNLLANAILTIMPLKGLSIIASGGYSYLFAREFNGQPSSVFNPQSNFASSTASMVRHYNIATLSADPRIQYNRTLFKKLNLLAIVGGSLRNQQTETMSIYGYGFVNDELLKDPASGANTNSVYNQTPSRYIGGFANLKLIWADKYILNLAGRRDGSSVFGPDHQFGNFGSVGGGWIISEEPWFRGLKRTVDFLKLEGSYGLEGASGVSPYSYISTYSVYSPSYGGGSGATPNNLSNPYLHWETDHNGEAGLSVDLFNGAVNLELEYYLDHVGDQLTSQPLASITGFTSFFINSPARIRTDGLEATLTTRNLRTKDFTWNTRINFTMPHSKLLAYPGIENLTTNYNYIVGKPITGVKLYNFAGIDPQKGVYNYTNAAGVKGEYEPFFSPTQLNPATDKTGFVDMSPKWFGGIWNSFTYKNFSMDFLVSVTDKVGPTYLGWQTYSLGMFNTNYPEDLAAKRWMKPGDKATVPKASAGFEGFLDQLNFVNSTGAFSNATYARLQNLSLSYVLPRQIAQKARLTTIKVYVSGQNLLTVSKYGSLDPENMSAGHMPPLRVLTGGLTITL